MKMTFPTCIPLFYLATAVAGAAELGGKLEPMFDQHCYECHDADVKKGGLDLAALKWQLDDIENLQQWTKVFDKVERGEMPPKKQERPAAEVSRVFLKTLHDGLHGFSRAKQESAGRVVYRRLNRTEYVQTMHDLLGIDTPLRDLLPEDGTAGGFDNIGEALNLSAVHLERYLQAADLALKEATVTTPQPETKKIRTDYNETWNDWGPGGFQHNQWAHSPEGLLAIRWNGGNGPHGELGAWSPPVPDARYRFRIRAKAMIDKTGPNAHPSHATRPDRHIILKVALTDWPRTGLTSGNTYFEMSPTEFREFTYEARVPRGKTLWLSPYRVVPELPDERAMVGGICAVIEWVDIEGPLQEEWPPRGHRLLYGDLPLQPADPKAPGKDLRVVSTQPEADARRLIAAFLPRVFRRPVSAEEIGEHAALVMDQMAKGRRFDEALRAAYKMALCSPKFLFLHEQPGALEDHALASRLSYGLWSTAPDAELSALAAQKKLRDPAVLRAQTERLLASPKARRFTQNLLGNWLNLRDIDFTQPDTKLYPEFEQYLQQSMVTETESYFEELLSKNLGVRHIIHSDFAMLNERLAEHYGIPGVKGGEVRKVALAADARRGGLITQGAVLKVSANGTSTSPVVRGAYVLDRLLGTPPDPPPKNVPAIEPDIRGATTIREQLDKHRNQPACAGCHAKLDPPGFALENYDVTGRWRTVYRAIPDSAKDKVVSLPGSDIRYYTPGKPVDPSFAMADGRAFKDVDEFKKIVLADPRQLARCVTEKLIVHLTGATIQFADREVTEAIVQRAAPGDYGLRTLLHEVIHSRLFTHK
jgi:mono/diheme cytochrome c family protein